MELFVYAVDSYTTMSPGFRILPTAVVAFLTQLISGLFDLFTGVGFSISPFIEEKQEKMFYLILDFQLHLVFSQNRNIRSQRFGLILEICIQVQLQYGALCLLLLHAVQFPVSMQHSLR